MFAEERGVAETYKTDLSTYYVVTADYAHNEGFYMVDNGLVIDLGDIDINYAGKTMIGRQYFGNNYGYYAYSWTELNSETAVDVTQHNFTYAMNEYSSYLYGFDYLSAAIGIDGTVYVNTYRDLHILNPETYETTKVGDFHWSDGVEATVYNLMVNPETYEMYAFCWFRHAPYGYCHGVAKVDLETCELTHVWKFTDIPAGSVWSYSCWAACFIDGNTIAMGTYANGNIGLYDLETGNAIDYINVDMVNPTHMLQQWGINGVCGSMLYNPDNNCLYLFANATWVRMWRYYEQGMIVIDLDTKSGALQSIGDGTISMHGMYFAEDVKPADFYYVMQLIDSIGEVTLEDGELLEQIRELYEELSEDRKARVENYETLLQAEHAYVILLAKYYAEEAQKAYEEAQKAAEEAKKAAEDAINETRKPLRRPKRPLKRLRPRLRKPRPRPRLLRRLPRTLLPLPKPPTRKLPSRL